MNIHWSFVADNPVIGPGQLHGDLDDRRAGAAHVLRIDDLYYIYYWASDADGYHRICLAQSRVDEPNGWMPLGSVLERQPDTDYNFYGPGFPFVVPDEEGPWLLYFGAWGKQRPDGKLPNTTGIAFSDDEGRSFHYRHDRPILPLDRPWDCEGTGSVCVLKNGDGYRMYYTSIGEYFERPQGVETGHGDIIPRIGVGYAVSDDGVDWDKPLDDLLVSPRGFSADPYEYIASKPFVVQEATGYRMWVNTFGTAYRVRTLTSVDGLKWRWGESGPDGDFGVGAAGGFDDRQRCYPCVVERGGQYRCWYTGNGFGTTGMGYATGEVA